ncbi:hypothetical protein ACFO25_05350 [Paenactinomyces guangxiensis]|uniref:Uncharacterized protein n=1 Tax=Paenactinomyces guangxiensis TaxID=1490290 RepID=A0A7W2A7B0_9BACL|nr:hypothetical protein [Paenactinomyces guangxiensis]MBA4494341.1 hypothetical protein [Paenactinomyces guangxiensis]MBH8590836.1 hypothetical protein [Paenactinomyces guangxiensis]
MDVQIYWNEEKKGVIPYPSLPALRLLCEQHGIRTRWNAEEKKMELWEANLTEKKIYLEPGSSRAPRSSDSAQYETEILTQVQHFLAAMGAEVLLQQSPSAPQDHADVYIQCMVSRIKSINNPQSTLVLHSNHQNKRLLHSIQKELIRMGFNNKVKKRIDKRDSNRFINIHIHLPEAQKELLRQEYQEPIAIGLASGILRYFHEKYPLAILSSLPPDIHEIFMTTRPNIHPKPATQEAGLGPSPVSAEKYLIESKELKAEVFFDYTLLLPGTDDNRCLIWGNLYIKNTGTENLVNPLVCLRSTPADTIQLRGQILPPNMTETLSVQDFEGAKGWRYLEEDWFKKAQERGEFWICPIQSIQIPPGEMEVHAFQISVLKPQSEGTVTIEGIVSFQEQGLQFPANNRISLSF